MLDASGREVGIQLNQSLPSVANVSDLSKHPVFRPRRIGQFLRRLDFRYLPSGRLHPAPPVQLARDGRLGSRLINTDYNNFAPRFGIAYSPSDNGRSAPASASSTRRRARIRSSI